MTNSDSKDSAIIRRQLSEYGERPPQYRGEEYDQRLREIRNAWAIAVINDAPSDRRFDTVMELKAAGKISETEFNRLCLALATTSPDETPEASAPFPH